jgi:hypothetical protein
MNSPFLVFTLSHFLSIAFIFFFYFSHFLSILLYTFVIPLESIDSLEEAENDFD